MKILCITKFITIFPENLSINNISSGGGGGGVSQKLILTNRGGGGGSQIVKIELMLFMDSPLGSVIICKTHYRIYRNAFFAVFIYI